MDLTPKQQTSEAIRQAETILIITGQHPSVDQAAAVLALSAILRKFGKKVSAIITDNPPAAVQTLDMGTIERGLGGLRDFVLKVDVNKAEVDKLRYEVEGGKLNIYLTPFKGSFAPSDVTFGYGAFHYDLAIVLGVPTRARIDRIYEQNTASFETIPVVNLDFHRSNENYGAVNLIEPNASSLCEMLVALSESLQSGIIDAEIASALLMGIVASTDRFTASHTSPKSLTVAAQMMAAGAKQQAVVRALYRDGKGDSRNESRGDRDRKSDGNDRRNDGERKSDNDRKPEGERRSDNDRNNNDRSERNNDRAPRSVASQQSAAQAAPQVASVPVQQPQAPAPAPVQPAVPQYEAPVGQPAPVATATQVDDEPIIQPGHIEMSMPEEQEQSAPVQQPVAASPVEQRPQAEAPAAAPAPAPAPAPVQPAPQLAPDRPQAMPIADFAAAAEMFNRDQG